MEGGGKRPLGPLYDQEPNGLAHPLLFTLYSRLWNLEGLFCSLQRSQGAEIVSVGRILSCIGEGEWAMP